MEVSLLLPLSPSLSVSCFVSVFFSFGQDAGFVFEISCDISSVKCQIEFIDNALRSSPALRRWPHWASESREASRPADCRTGRSTNYWRINSPAKWPRGHCSGIYGTRNQRRRPIKVSSVAHQKPRSNMQIVIYHGVLYKLHSSLGKNNAHPIVENRNQI